MYARKLAVTGTLLALGAHAASAAALPGVGITTPLGPFVGPNVTPAQLHPLNKPPWNQTIQFAGTDLGWNYTHGGQQKFLFGDTHAYRNIFTGLPEPIDPNYWGNLPEGQKTTLDDGFGFVDIGLYNNPAIFSSTNIPQIYLGQYAGSPHAMALNPQHWMDAFKTPFGGWSNGGYEFGIFYTSKPQGCLTSSHCSANPSLSCDNGLAFWNEEYFDQKSFTGGCIDGTFGCINDTMISGGNPVPGTGFCADRNPNNSLYTNTPVGRILTTATTHYISPRTLTDVREYEPFPNYRPWLTSKFRNITLATAQDFVPAEGAGWQNHNYNVAGSSGGSSGDFRRVFFWGRPSFVGIGTTRKNSLYFAYINMPTGGTLPSPLVINYYKGMSGNIPLFGTGEQEAVPLDLNSVTTGVNPDETHDIVSLQNVVWVDHLKKWVMLYGGGLTTRPTPPFNAFPTCGVVEFFVGWQECGQVNQTNRAIRMRTANDPWGPWSPPVDFFVPGNPNVSPPTGHYNGTTTGQNIFYHPNCTGTCRTNYMNFDAATEFGQPYAPNIVVPWIKNVGSSVDVIWTLSTWNPYGVYLMRTRINP